MKRVFFDEADHSYDESIFKQKIQDDIKSEAMSEFNKFRLGIIADQIRNKNGRHSINRVYNI